MKKEYILFDLDGTLTDPMVGITRSVQHALRAYGIEETDLNALCPFIGPPLKDSFMKYYGFSDKQAEEAIGKYREYFAVTGIFENRVYEGIETMLKNLRSSGRTLLVATSKPEEFAVKILEHFRLAPYFDWVCGASMDENRVRKGDVIAYALETAGIKDVSKAVMVGDREHDVIGAKEHSMDCVGVLFGYGSRQELEAAGAKTVAATVEELEQVLLAW
ncbi:MAG: HAD family hydrolase [Hungatella sp.]|nr:HAD family hydrolase [Hungatella sp.]